MAIQASDYMDFGNGIIGDDTFDVWRKKTNRIKVDLDTLDSTLTGRIDTDIASLSDSYIPKAGAATSVSTELQFSSATTFTNTISIGGSVLSGSVNKLICTPELESSTQITSNKVRAESNLILGSKTYNVPSSPALNNAVLVTQTNGNLSWQNPASVFANAGGLQQTTTVFEEVMPVGSVVALAGETNDPNFLYCNGAKVSKDTYRDLWDVIGYDYDTGLSGSEFRLPDYRGRVAVGVDNISNVAGWPLGTNIGDTGGTSNTSTSGTALGLTQIPSHSHTYTFQTDSKSNPTVRGIEETISRPGLTAQRSGVISNAGGNADGGTDAHSHAITPANRVQPYITVKWFIKAIKNSKLDFIIRLDSNSGLAAMDRSVTPNQPITDITPVDGVISLRTKVDGTSIEVNSDNQLSIKLAPVIIGDTKLMGQNILVGNNDTFNAIKFRGTTSDNQSGGYSHTVIAERIWGETEKSELLLFKGNDTVNSGPDRIRHYAAEHVFQTYELTADQRTYSNSNMDALSDTAYGTKLYIGNTGQVTLPATTMTDIKNGGDHAIITREYLEAIFSEDNGVLTINLDQG